MEIFAATLEETFYTFAIIFMSIILVLIAGLIIGGFVMYKRLQRKVRDTTEIPRKVMAFFNGFRRSW